MTDSQEHLILQYLQGKLPPEMRQAFETWRNESDENRRMTDDFQRIWLLTATKNKTEDFKRDGEWQKLEAMLNLGEPRITPWRAVERNWIKIAAAILLMVVSSAAIYLTLFRAERIVLQATENPITAVLPDGSEIWLNAGSKIDYEEDFSENRSMTLDGEGFFEVKPDTEKPFMVRAGSAEIKVLGTSFNVKAREMQTEVFVVTGKVSLRPTGGENVIMLTPGMTGILAQNDNNPGLQESDLNALAWKNKELVFSKSTVATVLKTLRSYFKKEVRVKDSALLTCRFTGSFTDPTLDEVIESLAIALDLKFEMQHGVYVLDGSGCAQ